MKKILITFVLSIIGFIGFSSAVFMQEFSLSSSVCTPGQKVSYNWSISENGLSAGDYNLIDINSDNALNEIYLRSNAFGSKSYYGNNFSVSNDFFVAGGRITFYYYCYDLPVINGKKTLTFKVVSSDYVPPVVEGGSSNITPVITGLFGVYGELIPYVVYIGIGILIVTVGFYAIRWLVNLLVNKIIKYFK